MQEQLLRHAALFAEVPPARLDALAQLVRRRAYQRGETIFHKGDPGNAVYLVTRGQVKIVLPAETGEEAVLGLLEPGDLFGELALFDGLPRSATMVALENVETLLLHRDDFLRFVAQHPEVGLGLLAVLSRRLRATDELLEDAVFLDVPGRLAKRLLELAERHGQQTDQGIQIGVKLTQQDLAGMIGATRESVNKHLSWLRDRGVIQLDRQRITVLRPEELRKRIY